MGDDGEISTLLGDDWPNVAIVEGESARDVAVGPPPAPGWPHNLPKPRHLEFLDRMTRVASDDSSGPRVLPSFGGLPTVESTPDGRHVWSWGENTVHRFPVAQNHPSLLSSMDENAFGGSGEAFMTSLAHNADIPLVSAQSGAFRVSEQLQEDFGMSPAFLPSAGIISIGEERAALMPVRMTTPSSVVFLIGAQC